MKNLTLVIPAKEEKESLPKVLNELKKYKLKKIVVLEKKDIDTIKSIQNFNCKILFQKNNGYGAAIIEGIKTVRTKYFCIFNADGSFNPEELKTMINKIKISLSIIYNNINKIIIKIIIKLNLIKHCYYYLYFL